MSLRPAEPGDAAGIRAVHEAAFPTTVEADLVEALIREGDAIISLVAERQGEIVGHVLLSRMQVRGDGRDLRALGLGPVGVLPGYQGGGIGAALIEGAVASPGRPARRSSSCSASPIITRASASPPRPPRRSPPLMRGLISWRCLSGRTSPRLRTVRRPMRAPSPISARGAA